MWRGFPSVYQHNFRSWPGMSPPCCEGGGRGTPAAVAAWWFFFFILGGTNCIGARQATAEHFLRGTTTLLSSGAPPGGTHGTRSKGAPLLTVCGGRRGRHPGNLADKLAIWRAHWQFGGRIGNLAGGVAIWRAHWQFGGHFGGKIGNLAGILANWRNERPTVGNICN